MQRVADKAHSLEETTKRGRSSLLEIYNTPNTVQFPPTGPKSSISSTASHRLIWRIFFSKFHYSYWSVISNSIFSACVSHQYFSRAGLLLITPVMETHVRCFSKHVEFCLWMPIPEEFVLLKEDFFFFKV